MEETILNMEDNILGQEKISKLFIKFSIPAIIATVISAIQTMIDGIFVGNFVGPNAMASISLTTPFIQIMIGFSMVISIGGLSYMGRSLGEGNLSLTRDIFKTSNIILSVGAILLSFLGIFFSSNIATLIGANEVLVQDVSSYITIISFFSLPMALSFLFGYVDRLLEKPNLYFKGMVLSLALNIILDFILIKILGLGVKGAAFATGISYSSVLFLVIGPVLNKSSTLNIYSGRFNIKTILPVVYNGSSEAMYYLAAAISAYLFNMAFITLLGEDGVSAFTIINYIAQFGLFIIFGISDGVSSIISYNYGAENFSRVKEIFNLSLKISLIIGILTFLALFFFAEPLVKMFMNSNEIVLEIAKEGARLYAIAFLINGFNTLSACYFTAIGFAKESIIIALSKGLVFIIIGIFILPEFLGINGLWLTIPFAEALTLFICLYLNNKNKLEPIYDLDLDLN